MDDILSVLDEVSMEEENAPIDTKSEARKAKDALEEMVQNESFKKMGRVNYKVLRDMMGSKNLYAVKNSSKKDLVCDWDLSLIPEELKPEFDKYLSNMYNLYQIKEANLDFRIVVVYRQGRSINFLHQFMTEKGIPNLVTVREGREILVKSQFVLPAGEMAIITEQQYESLKRYEKKRQITNIGESDWSGSLVFKQITSPETLEKIEHSFVTVSDIKNNEFEIQEHDLNSTKKSVTIEYSNELDEL